MSFVQYKPINLCLQERTSSPHQNSKEKDGWLMYKHHSYQVSLLNISFLSSSAFQIQTLCFSKFTVLSLPDRYMDVTHLGCLPPPSVAYIIPFLEDQLDALQLPEALLNNSAHLWTPGVPRRYPKM